MSSTTFSLSDFNEGDTVEWKTKNGWKSTGTVVDVTDKYVKVVKMVAPRGGDFIKSIPYQILPEKIIRIVEKAKKSDSSSNSEVSRA